MVNSKLKAASFRSTTTLDQCPHMKSKPPTSSNFESNGETSETIAHNKATSHMKMKTAQFFKGRFVFHGQKAHAPRATIAMKFTHVTSVSPSNAT